MVSLDSVLTSVRVLGQAHPEVGGLEHVIQAIHDFVVIRGAFLKAIKANSFHLFTIALRVVDQSSRLSSFEKLQQYRHAVHAVAAEMTNDKEALTAIKKLYKRHPAPIDSQAVNAITRRGSLKILQWLYDSQGPTVFTKFHKLESAFAFASEHGRDDIVRWLVRRFPDLICNLTYAAIGGHFDQIRWLVENAKLDKASIGHAVEKAAIRGDFEMTNFLHGISTVPYTVSLYMVREPKLSVIKWLHENNCGSDWSYCPDNAASTGSLEIIQWFDVNRSEDLSACSSSAMETAAEYGHLELVKWLHVHHHKKCLTRAMVFACRNGHLEVIQWMYNNRTGRISSSLHGGMLSSAASNGHIHVMKWLHANTQGNSLPEAFESAIDHNHVNAATWLYERIGKAQCTKAYIDHAAAKGFLDMVSWLHFSCIGECSTEAMDRVAQGGHLDVLKFLHKHRQEGCTDRAMQNAIEYNHLNVVKWLYNVCHVKISSSSLTRASAINDLVTTKWVCAHYKGKCPQKALIRAVSNGHLDVLKKLHANPAIVWSQKLMKSAVTKGWHLVVEWLYSEAKLDLYAGCEVDAACTGNLRLLEFIRTNTNFCKNPTIYFSASSTGQLEVALWYSEYYGTPRKRKRSALTE